jgi:hypothetical protein
MPLLCTPVLLVMLLMFYWLVWVLFTQGRSQAWRFVAAGRTPCKVYNQIGSIVVHYSNNGKMK